MKLGSSSVHKLITCKIIRVARKGKDKLLLMLENDLLSKYLNLLTSQIYFTVLACGKNIRSAVTNFDFLKIHLENRQSPLVLCYEVERTSREMQCKI